MGVRPEPDLIGSRIEHAIGRYGPFGGLATGSAITLATAATPYSVGSTSSPWIPLAVLVPVTAVWSYVLAFRPAGPPTGEHGHRTVRASDPRVGPVYVVGFLALAAGLIHLSPWFAFLALAGYAHSYEYLPGRWRYVGISVMAVLHAYSTIGGRFADLTPMVVLAWILISALIAGVSITFTVMGARTSELSERRARTIEELNEANRQLAETLDENAMLHARLLAQARDAGVLDERARLAREIHDTIAQGLTGVVTQLEAAGAAEGEAHARHLDTAADVAKHARASRVGLTLSYMDDVVVLDVRDDGVGFDPQLLAAPSGGSGFGLAAMEQRVARVSGTLAVESAPGEGTAVSATVPAHQKGTP